MPKQISSPEAENINFENLLINLLDLKVVEKTELQLNRFINHFADGSEL